MPWVLARLRFSPGCFTFFLEFAGIQQSATYDTYFSYTSKPVNGLSTASANASIGAGETHFGT